MSFKITRLQHLEAAPADPCCQKFCTLSVLRGTVDTKFAVESILTLVTNHGGWSIAYYAIKQCYEENLNQYVCNYTTGKTFTSMRMSAAAIYQAKQMSIV